MTGPLFFEPAVPVTGDRYTLRPRYELTESGRQCREWVESTLPNWSVVFFGTFRQASSFVYAGKAQLWFAREVSKEVLGDKLGRKQHVPWFASFERHQSGFFHVNMLLEGCEELNLGWAHDQWFKRYGLPRVLRYDPGAGDTLGYLLKRVGIDAEIDAAWELAARATIARP